MGEIKQLTDTQLDYIASGSNDCSCTDCCESHRLGKLAALELADLRRQIAERDVQYKVVSEHLESREHQIMSLCSIVGVQAEEHLEGTIECFKAQLALAREMLNTLDCLIEDMESGVILDNSVQMRGYLRDAEKAREELKSALAPETPSEQKMPLRKYCTHCDGTGIVMHVKCPCCRDPEQPSPRP